MYQIETKNYGHGMLNKLFPVSLPKKILFAIQFTVKVFSLSLPLLTQFINFSTESFRHQNVCYFHISLNLLLSLRPLLFILHLLAFLFISSKLENELYVGK